MASQGISPLVPPLLNTLKFDYDAGTTVKVKTRNDKTFRGEVYENPSKTSLPNSITIINVVDEDTGKPVTKFLHLFQSEILSVTRVESAPKSLKKPQETVMATCVVTTLEHLDQVMSAVEEVKEVGCYVPGSKEGRLGSPSCVILNVKNVLVVVNIPGTDSARKQWWEKLGIRLFGNPKVVKICLDSRGISDYLYHKTNTVLTNAFDIRATELFLLRKLESNPWCDCRNEGTDVKVTLADLLRKYLSQTVPLCDLNGVQQTGSAGHNLDKNYKKFYALKVKYLPLLKSEQTKVLLAPLESSVSKLCRQAIVENAVAFVSK